MVVRQFLNFWLKIKENFVKLEEILQIPSTFLKFVKFFKFLQNLQVMP